MLKKSQLVNLHAFSIVRFFTGLLSDLYGNNYMHCVIRSVFLFFGYEGDVRRGFPCGFWLCCLASYLSVCVFVFVSVIGGLRPS